MKHKYHNTKTLSQEEIAALDAVGFDWSLRPTPKRGPNSCPPRKKKVNDNHTEKNKK
jgi:hypothetical protein